MRNNEGILKPNPERIAEILAGVSMVRVRLVLKFVEVTLVRLRDGTLQRVEWCELADEMGILEEVSKVIDAFDLTEEEFYSRYSPSKGELEV